MKSNTLTIKCELLVSIHLHFIVSGRVVFMFVDLNHLGTSGLRLALRDLGFGYRLDNSPMWTHTSILRLDFRDLGQSRNVALKKFIGNMRYEPNTRMDTSIRAEVNIMFRVKKHEVKCNKIRRE